jgi:branched-chain amino acid transport system substrate-binding protein
MKKDRKNSVINNAGRDQPSPNRPSRQIPNQDRRVPRRQRFGAVCRALGRRSDQYRGVYPTTGSMAQIGVERAAAAKLAVEMVNEAGGIAARRR